jgi:hypothetical protein
MIKDEACGEPNSGEANFGTSKIQPPTRAAVARAAWTELKALGKKSWTNWCAIIAWIQEVDAQLFDKHGAHLGGAGNKQVSKEFKKIRERERLDLDGSELSWCLKCLPYFDEIQAWHPLQPSNWRLNHPKVVFPRWAKTQNLGDNSKRKGKGKRTSVKDYEAIIQGLEIDLHQARQDSGNYFDPISDSAEDIARTMVALVSISKALKIARIMTTLAKAKEKVPKTDGNDS